MTMREVPGTTRGSGPVHCCGGHREHCLFGRQHTWSRPWFENGRVQRLATTYHCHDCGGVCTAEESDCARCGESTGVVPVSLPDDPLRRRWCSSSCRDAELEKDRRQAQIRERAAYLAARIDFREFPVNTHITGPCYVCQDPVQPHRDLVAWSTEEKGSDTYPAVDLHPSCLSEVKRAREHAERLASVSALTTTANAATEERKR